MKLTDRQADHLAKIASDAYVNTIARAKALRADGFTSTELDQAMKEAWRAAVRAAFGEAL